MKKANWYFVMLILFVILGFTFAGSQLTSAEVLAWEQIIAPFGAGFESTWVGGWVRPNSVQCAVGDVIITRTRTPPNTDDRDWARWRPTIPATDWYDVYVYIPQYSGASAATTTKARYRIHHADGDTIVSPINQATGLCGWRYLGNFRFNSGTDGYVYMGDYTGDNPYQIIGADGMKFVRVLATPTVTQTPTVTPTSSPSPSLPNLQPAYPSGWSGPIVPSYRTGATSWENLSGLQYTYIDLAIRNSGNATASSFSISLYLDSTKIKDWYISSLTPGNTYRIFDHKYFICPPNHILRLAIDENNTVHESNESDNTYQHSFQWTGGVPIDQGTWMPCGQTTPTISLSGDHANVNQYFVWDQSHRNTLVNKGGVYQYEIRRDREYWDYFYSGSFCYRAYYSNLPGHTDRWSEESDSNLSSCLLRLCIPYYYPCDEEFEVKTKRLTQIEAGKLYYVGAHFYRDTGDRNKPMTLTTESEWCRDWPLCSDSPGRFYYGRMNVLSINSFGDITTGEPSAEYIPAATTPITPTIVELGNNDYLVVISQTQILIHSPVITNSVQLNTELTQSAQRVSLLNDTTMYSATVTFRQPLQSTELELLLANTNIESVRFYSWPEGGGKTPYPPDPEVMEQLSIGFSAFISETYGIANPILIDSYVAAEISATGSQLKLLSLNSLVLSIDPGPIEYLQTYPDAILMPGDDIYYDFETLLIDKSD